MKFTFEKELQKEEIQSVLEIGFEIPKVLFYLFHLLNPERIDGI
jgi:hypothetical protein